MQTRAERSGRRRLAGPLRPGLVVLLTLLAAGAVAPYPQSPASATCVAPSLVGERIVLTHDGKQTVEGRFFHDGCGDTQSCTLGCGCETDDPESPSTDVELRITQQGRSWSLGKVDADEDHRVTWTFRLPAVVTPGPARLLAEGASPVQVRVR